MNALEKRPLSSQQTLSYEEEEKGEVLSLQRGEVQKKRTFFT